MLNHFDTVFAFVAVLTAISLVVTSLTQMVGALFALRGRHLRSGLAGLLANYAPQLRPYAEPLSGHLLNHPLLSDSVFSQRRWIPLNRWSAAAFFFWRGWKYANAVRPGELRAIVQNLADNLNDVDASLREALASIGDGKEPGRAFEGLLAQARKVAKTDTLASYWLRTAEVYVEAASRLRENDAEARVRLSRLLTGLFQAMEGSRKLGAVFDRPAQAGTSEPRPAAAWDQWFDCTMDRVSQSFATNMRVWTVLFSVTIAVLLPVDAIRLYKRLSADPELRARVIASSQDLTRKAEELGVGTTNAPAVVEAEVRLRTSAERLQGLLDDQVSLLPLSRGTGPGEGGSLHWFGILASAVLLSLGAPFWFNALRKMSNLRPLLANKQEAEEQKTSP